MVQYHDGGLFHHETQTDVIHEACIPTGDATLDCGNFMKCYEYDDYYKYVNSTWHDSYVEKGGICDCYNFWGYGYFPNCQATSKASLSIFFMVCVIPYIILATGFYFSAKTIYDLRKLKQFQMNVVGRGLFLNCLAPFFGTFWTVSSGLSVYAPYIDTTQISTYYLFNMGMGMYSATFVPAFLVLPICWLENVIRSKKMKKAQDFKKSQNLLRITSVVVGLSVVSLQAVRLYRLSQIVIVGFLLFGVFAYYYCSKQILHYAGDMMPKGQKMAMNKTKYEITICVVVYLLCAVVYSRVTKKRNWGTFRPPAILIGLNMICVGLIHLFLIRYLRYQCRKNLAPSWFLREEQFWDYLDLKTEKQKSKRSTMSPGGRVMSGHGVSGTSYLPSSSSQVEMSGTSSPGSTMHSPHSGGMSPGSGVHFTKASSKSVGGGVVVGKDKGPAAPSLDKQKSSRGANNASFQSWRSTQTESEVRESDISVDAASAKERPSLVTSNPIFAEVKSKYSLSQQQQSKKSVGGSGSTRPAGGGAGGGADGNHNSNKDNIDDGVAL
jgi:hypothetical protein